MELVMPMNYEFLEQDEMMYLDGGWSWQQAVNNAIGVTAVGTLAFVENYLRKAFIANKGASLGTMIAKVSVQAAKAFWVLPWWAKIAGLAAGAAVVYAFGTWDIS